MKIRNGFVSNSSSASFCIIGFGIPKEDGIEEVKNAIDLWADEEIDWDEVCGETTEEKVYEYMYNQRTLALFEGQDDDCPKDQYTIGIHLAMGDDFGLDKAQIDIVKKVIEMEGIMHKMGYIDDKVYVYTGERSI